MIVTTCQLIPVIFNLAEKLIIFADISFQRRSTKLAPILAVESKSKKICFFQDFYMVSTGKPIKKLFRNTFSCLFRIFRTFFRKYLGLLGHLWALFRTVRSSNGKYSELKEKKKKINLV